MRFKIDEHLPFEITELLDQHQHDVVTVADESMSGAVDPDVAQVCQREARALLSILTSLTYGLTRRKITRGLSSFVLHYRAPQLLLHWLLESFHCWIRNR